jgi:uncharacterized membrane protein SirB2
MLVAGSRAGERLFFVLKGIHIATVATTLALFLLRSVWAFQASPHLRHPVMRWLPHVNDTVLFGAALGAAAMLGQYPFVNDWLTAKVLALCAYIVLGHMTLWRARTHLERAGWMVAALATFGYIMLVARCHDPNVWACGLRLA